MSIIFFNFFFLLNLFSNLHITSEVLDIPETYIHLIHTKQYYALQYIYSELVFRKKKTNGQQYLNNDYPPTITQ